MSYCPRKKNNDFFVKLANPGTLGTDLRTLLRNMTHQIAATKNPQIVPGKYILHCTILNRE